MAGWQNVEAPSISISFKGLLWGQNKYLICFLSKFEDKTKGQSFGSGYFFTAHSDTIDDSTRDMIPILYNDGKSPWFIVMQKFIIKYSWYLKISPNTYVFLTKKHQNVLLGMYRVTFLSFLLKNLENWLKNVAVTLLNSWQAWFMVLVTRRPIL
jgi:hypothetical protein